MSKTVSTCICETNLIANQPQENVFFLTLSRKKEDFPNEFLRTARSTSPIQVCAVFSCIGPDNAGAMLNIDLNRELEQIVASTSKSPVLDFEAFSNQVISVLNVRVCKVSASVGTPLKVSMTMIVIEGDILRVIHVGNTKATLLRDNRLMVLTEEHTVAHKYVQMGAITPEQELSHPDNMNLTQYLGKMPQDGPVVPSKKVELKLKDNDEIFLMGLGISHLMPAQMRNLILVRQVSPETKARELMNSAMNFGIKSGLTAICMKIESTFLLPGDAVIGSHLATDATMVHARQQEPDSYTPFGDPSESAAPASRRGRQVSKAQAAGSDTIPFNPNEQGDYYEEEEEDIEDYGGYNEPVRNDRDRRNKNKKIAAFVIPVVIFLISVVIGFGLMYLIFNFKDLFKGSAETTQTSSDNLIYYVVEDGTPVFAQADINSTLVASLNRGDAVTVLSVESLFSKITTTSNVTGYILNEKLTLDVPDDIDPTSIIETDDTSASSDETDPDATEPQESSSDTSEDTVPVAQPTRAAAPTSAPPTKAPATKAPATKAPATKAPPTETPTDPPAPPTEKPTDPPAPPTEKPADPTPEPQPDGGGE